MIEAAVFTVSGAFRYCGSSGKLISNAPAHTAIMLIGYLFFLAREVRHYACGKSARSYSLSRIQHVSFLRVRVKDRSP